MDNAGDCIFCGIIAGRLAAARVLDEGGAVAFMDAFPFRPGHVLVTLRRHTALAGELEGTERAGLIEAGNRVANAMRVALPGCQAINWIINDGRAAGQSVPHVHLHLIPRQTGDRGLMIWRFARHALLPRRSHRVAPEALERKAELIRNHL